MNGQVKALPDGSVMGVMGFLSESISTGARGVIVASMTADGADIRVFGDVLREDLSWAAAVLLNHAVNGPRADDSARPASRPSGRSA
jgi:hypothetical protein